MIMDELNLVREHFPEQPPPSPEVTAAARARLPLSRAPRRRAGRRTAARRLAVPVTAIAAAAAAAVAVTAVVSAPGGHATRRPRAAASGAAVYHLPAGAHAQLGSAAAGRRILLTAAGTVARASSPTRPAPGRFFVSPTQAGNFLVVGPARRPYVVLERANDQDWAARSTKAWSPSFYQLLRLQFASAADEAAWRRDGSPAQWDVTVDNTISDPHGVASGTDGDITIAPGKLAEVGASHGGKQFTFGSNSYSAAQLLRLPASPARLKQMLLATYIPGREGQGVNREVYLFELTPALLTLPVTPAVRSALYRMLAGLPGVRSLGQVQDVAGQYGEAVALDRGYRGCGDEELSYRNGSVSGALPVFRSCVVEQRLVINPRTGLPLALELRYLKLSGGRTWPGPDGLFSFELFQRAYWTNASPPDVHN
jgi:hypothetical protein